MKNKLYIYFFLTLLFFWNIHVFALNNLSWNITSDWKDGFCYNFSLNNTSWKEISDWKIYFKLDANTLLTSQRSWNFSHNGNNYIITPVEWNKNISSNSKIDIGFCANGISRPFDITIPSDNVIPENPVVSIPEKPQIPIIPENNSLQDLNLNKDWWEVSFITTSKREWGYCRKIIVKNTTQKIINNWEISFHLDQVITGWSANYIKTGNIYTVQSLDWNKEIIPNSQVEIWFCSVGKLYDNNQTIHNFSFKDDIIILPNPSTGTGANNNWDIIDNTGSNNQDNSGGLINNSWSIVILPKNNLFAWYYPNRSIWNYPYNKIDYSKLDIINFAFIYPNYDGTLLGTQEAKYPELINESHKNGKKIVISIWWWNLSYNFLWVTLNPNYRNKFISEVKKIVWDNNYDGIDLDWEFPNSAAEWKLFLDLIKDLKKELPWKIISTAISINYDFFDIETLSNLVDYVYVMAYDIEWWWNWYAGYNSPLYKNSKMPYDMSLDGFMKAKFLNKKIDRSKFILGYPLYGRKFNVAEPYMKAYSSETIEYKDLPKNCIDKWDSESKVPYLSCGSYYISYDNLKSLDEKIKYANNKLLGWVFVWAIWQDNWEIIKTLDTSNIQQSISTPILTITSQSKISPTEKIQTSTIDIWISKKINASLDTFIVKNKVNLPTKLIQIKTKLKILQQKYKNDIKKLSIVNLYMEIIDKKISELK